MANPSTSGLFYGEQLPVADTAVLGSEGTDWPAGVTQAQDIRPCTNMVKGTIPQNILPLNVRTCTGRVKGTVTRITIPLNHGCLKLRKEGEKDNPTEHYTVERTRKNLYREGWRDSGTEYHTVGS